MIKYILMVLGLFTISCSHKENFQTTFLIDDKEVYISESYFYLNERGTLYYYIPDENKRNEIFKNSVVKEIRFFFNDSSMTAKPISDSMFSHELPSSNFMFLVDKETNKVITDVIEGKIMIVIIPNKTKDVNGLISKGILNVNKFKQYK